MIILKKSGFFQKMKKLKNPNHDFLILKIWGGWGKKKRRDFLGRIFLKFKTPKIFFSPKIGKRVPCFSGEKKKLGPQKMIFLDIFLGGFWGRWAKTQLPDYPGGNFSILKTLRVFDRIFY